MEGRKIAILGAASALSAAALTQYAEGDEEIRKTVRDNTVEPPVPNGIPDRMSIDRASPHYASCGEYVGIRVNGQDLTGRVVEFCVSGRWARITDQPRGVKLTYQQVKEAPRVSGDIETFWAREPNRQVRRQLARMR